MTKEEARVKLIECNRKINELSDRLDSGADVETIAKQAEEVGREMDECILALK